MAGVAKLPRCRPMEAAPPTAPIGEGKLVSRKERFGVGATGVTLPPVAD